MYQTAAFYIPIRSCPLLLPLLTTAFLSGISLCPVLDYTAQVPTYVEMHNHISRGDASWARTL